MSYFRNGMGRIRIDVSVSNDLLCDNRVDKTCRSLSEYGLEVRLTGKRTKDSPDLNPRPYKCERIRVFFRKNALYYAELNVRLFFKLLFSRQDILWANDLDTLSANFLVSRIKRKPLIFDSHEHFTQVPELKNNPFAQKVWTKIEKYCVSGLKYVVTVCNPIREYFKDRYGVEAVVVRNMPLKRERQDAFTPAEDKENVVVWQGAVNVERGLEELCEAFKWINAKLYIIGQGDIRDELERHVEKEGLGDRIRFFGRLPFEEMMSITEKAKLGVSIDKDTNMNYAVSLPNKIFEYIHCSVPILASPLREIKPIIEKYETGEFIRSYDSKDLSMQINGLISDNEKLNRYAENCRSASEDLTWQKEEKKIFRLIDKVLQER